MSQIRSGLTIGILAQLPMILNQLISRGIWSGWVVFYFAVIAVSLTLALHTRLSRDALWFLVPGGVVVRHTRPRKGFPLLQRFTPVDSILLVEQDGNQFGWKGSLNRVGTIVEKQLTPCEIQALLAAWQSPLPPPPVEKLVDLH